MYTWVYLDIPVFLPGVPEGSRVGVAEGPSDLTLPPPDYLPWIQTFK